MLKKGHLDESEEEYVTKSLNSEKESSENEEDPYDNLKPADG